MRWADRIGVRRRLVIALGVTCVAAPTVAACGSEGGLTVNVYYAPEENFQQVIDQCNARAEGRYEIVYRKLPRDADGQREQMVRRLAAGDTGLDVLGLDVTWVPEFAEANWLEEWTGDNRSQAEQGVLEGPLATAKWDGKLYAATKNTNVQLLWYDQTVTPQPPRTWDEMMRMAQDLRNEGKPYQILFTGAQYEGLVVQYNSIVSSAGGQILSEDGRQVVMDEGAVRGLEILQRVATSGLTNPSLTTAQETEVSLGFATPGSQAAFQLNWPFVYAAIQGLNPERAKNFRWTRYPGVDGDSRVTIGGYNLGVSAYSQHKPEAFEAALCLRSEESQKFSAIKDGVPPTIEAIFFDETPIDPGRPEDAKENPSMNTAYPMKDAILEALQNPAVRPLTPVYQNLSTVISKVLSPPAGIDPPATRDRLHRELQRALDSKGVLP